MGIDFFRVSGDLVSFVRPVFQQSLFLRRTAAQLLPIGENILAIRQTKTYDTEACTGEVTARKPDATSRTKQTSRGKSKTSDDD